MIEKSDSTNPMWIGEKPKDAEFNHIIAIGKDAYATKDYQLILTWDDGTETRIDLPHNRWLRGFTK